MTDAGPRDPVPAGNARSPSPLRGAADLLPLVYDELRALARKQMKGERPDHTLQATALVHEAFKRLASKSNSWSSLGHFYQTAAMAMRNVLIDHARQHNADKRGGGQKRATIEIANIHDLAAEGREMEIVDLEDAIVRLGQLDAVAESVVRLRLYTGLTIERTALALEASETLVEKKWAFGRAWLAREMRRAQ